MHTIFGETRKMTSATLTFVRDTMGPAYRQRVKDIEEKLGELPDALRARVSKYMDLPIDHFIAAVREVRDSTPDRKDNPEYSNNFTRLDNVLLPVMELQRRLDIMDVLGPYSDPSPDVFDVLLSDVKPDDLPGKISDFLKVAYLSDTNEIGKWPLYGKVVTTHKPAGIAPSKLRVFFTMPVAARGKAVNVHFIFDTGAPRTYIAKSVLDALAVPEASIGGEIFKFNGIKWSDINISDSQTITHTVSVHGEVVNEEGPCHFVGLNVLGMDLMDRINAKLVIDMKEMVAELVKQPDM